MPLRFLLSRLLLAVVSLWGVSVLVFAILRILPGDPALLMAPVGSTMEDIERVRREFGLTGSWWAQYGAFFLSLCQGNVGRSLWLQQDALRVILGGSRPRSSWPSSRSPWPWRAASSWAPARCGGGGAGWNRARSRSGPWGSRCRTSCGASC